MRKRRFTNVIVAMLVVVGILSSSMDAQAKSFPDVPAGSWFAPYVDYVSDRGIMTGLDSGKFAPQETMIRAQTALAFYRLAGSPNVQYHPYFTDISEAAFNGAAFYGKAAIWCYENGIMTGYQGKTFGPGNFNTREELATILYRYAKFVGCNVTANGDLNQFPDASAVAPFAVEGMKFAVQYGLITGDQGKLNPRGTVNRAVAATILCRFDQNILGN